MLTMKACNTKLTDHGLSCIVKCCPNLTHLELNRTDLTEVGTKSIATGLTQLKFLDMSGISGITLAMLDEIKQKRPDLLLRQFQKGKIDPKDNGLRVPWRVVDKEGKKKKKKK